MVTQAPSVAYRRVYVWQWPVRLYHWVNALCVVALSVTGFLIGQPVSIWHASEAYQQYWFGWVRFIHFAAAYIFFFNFLLRIYWGFVGNRFARWNAFIPHTSEQWREMLQVLRVDILLARLRGQISIGHNALAGLTYFVSFLVFLFQAITGFGLYSSMSRSFFPRLFTWVIPLMGGDMHVRQWHHLFMWFFVVFTIIHVYLVAYHDHVEARGTVSSMLSGWKFVKGDGSKK
jgi:Ni/Fe-hydrogenase 1 B-type cytochrome subunit